MAFLYSFTLGHAPDEHLSRHFALDSKVLHARTLGMLGANRVPRNKLPPCNLVPPKWKMLACGLLI